MTKGFISPTLVALINLIIAARFIATTTKEAYQIATSPAPLRELAGRVTSKIAGGVFDQSMNPISRLSVEAREEAKPISRLAEKWERVAKRVDLNRTRRISVGAWGDLLYLQQEVRDRNRVVVREEGLYTTGIHRTTPSSYPVSSRRVSQVELNRKLPTPSPEKPTQLTPEITLYR